MSTLVLPSSDDPVVAGATEVIGGPPGAHARIGERRFWTTTRVLVALTLLTCLLGWAQKAPCRDASTWVHEHQYTRACYTDVVALYSSEGLSEGQAPYYGHPVEYPVVIGAVMQLSSVLARGLSSIVPDSDVDDADRAVAAAKDPVARDAAVKRRDYLRGVARSRHFYDLTWLLLTVCALVVTLTTAKLAGRRRWDAAMFALAPGLLIHGTTNWDLVAVALAGLGLLAWARKHPVIAGALLGLATATKLYPVLFLVPLFLLCLRAGKLRQGLTTVVITLVVAVGVTAPVYLSAPSFGEVQGQQVILLDSPLSRVSAEGLSALAPTHSVNGVKATNAVYRFFELNQTRGADWDSLYFQLQHLRAGPHSVRTTIADWFTDTTSPPTKLNRWVAVLVLLVMAGVAWIALRARRRPRLPQLLFLTLAGFLLVNKVDSPQYVTWLLPLAVLARPRWRPFLAWQAAEVLVMLSRFYMFIGNDKPGEGITLSWYFLAVLVRDALLVTYLAFVVREIRHPDKDRVRADGLDDPAGGVLDGAPDRVRSARPAAA